MNSSDQVSRLVNKEDNPDARYEEQPRPRTDKCVHREYAEDYDGEKKEYLRGKTKFASYDLTCDGGAFVDLVVDEVEDGGGWRKKEKIGLRVVSRLPTSPLELDHTMPQRFMVRKRIKDRSGEAIEDPGQRFTESEIFNWSPAADMAASEELKEVMCPGGRVGEMAAKLGFEGLVYLAGKSNENGERHLVFVSFDSGFGFEGMRRMDGTAVQSRQRGPRMENSITIAQPRGEVMTKLRADAPFQAEDKLKAPSVDKGRQVAEVQAWSQFQRLAQQTQSSAGFSTEATPRSSKQPRERLLWRERAQYLSLNKGWWLR